MAEPSGYQIQNPVDVARRALAMSAYCCRAYIDDGNGNAEAESVRDRVIQWISRFNISTQLGPFERKVIHAPLGSLPADVKNRMSWEAEGLAVLVWALGLGGLPKHDGEVDPYAVTDSVFFLGDLAEQVIAKATLRDDDELRAYRELMYAIHCRVRDFQTKGERKDFARWIQAEWLDCLQIDQKCLLVDSDLGFNGQSIATVGTDQLKRYEWGIAEQHRASIWLAGEEKNYWQTNADT